MKYLWFKNGMTAYVTNNATLEDAVADGASIFRENDDGTTSMIYDGASWLTDKPDIDAENQPFVVVAPIYVDDRMKAVVDVFDALAASVPAVAASADVQPVSSKARSAMSFAEALEALRALAYGTGEEGGE
jgi:hypothetical protein